jgi:hypothetical protein
VDKTKDRKENRIKRLAKRKTFERVIGTKKTSKTQNCEFEFTRSFLVSLGKQNN